MLGRLLSNLIALSSKVKPLVVHNLFLFLAGMSCIAVPFCLTFDTMAAAAFCYGIFIGKSRKYLIILPKVILGIVCS